MHAYALKMTRMTAKWKANFYQVPVNSVTVMKTLGLQKRKETVYFLSVSALLFRYVMGELYSRQNEAISGAREHKIEC